jgi:BA14K-like protein
MPFIFYLSLLLFTATAALFGLDLVTEPLPPVIGGTAIPPGQDLAQARNKLARRMADQRDATMEGDPQHVLTPIYPANPGGVPVIEQSNSTIADQDATKRETTGAAPRETTGAAAVHDQPAPSEQSAQPVAQHAVNSCNVDACAAHYRSFRASDCTYQPYQGPRRFCDVPRAHDQSAARAAMPQATRIPVVSGNDDLARSYVPVHQPQATLPFSGMLFHWLR